MSVTTVESTGSFYLRVLIFVYTYMFRHLAVIGSTKSRRRRMKLNIELYLKVDFVGTGWVYKRPISETGKETHMDIPVFSSFYCEVSINELDLKFLLENA